MRARIPAWCGAGRCSPSYCLLPARQDASPPIRLSRSGPRTSEWSRGRPRAPAAPGGLLVGTPPARVSASGGCWASWYASPFGPYTTAARDWPKGTLIRVSYGSRSIIVTVRDYGPQSKPRCLDLDDDAFAALAPLSVGVINVRWAVVR